MTAPLSHAQQCITCHKVSDSLDRPLPPKHPRLENLNLAPPSAGMDSLFPPGTAHPARSRGLVWSLAFSPDGHHLAIGQQGLNGLASILRVWDHRRPRGEESWVARSAAYRCLAFSPDGKKLATGTFDCAVELYGLDGVVASLQGFWQEQEPINALAFLGDGRIIVGDWAGKIIYIRTTQQPQVVARYPGKIFALAASRDGSTLAVAGETGIIEIIEVDTGQVKATLHGHDLSVESLDFSPDGKHLASASWDRTVARVGGEHGTRGEADRPLRE